MTKAQKKLIWQLLADVTDVENNFLASETLGTI